MNETIEAAARDRGITVDQLFRETSERVLQHMTPTARANVLLRESRRAGALRESRTGTPVAKSKPTKVAAPANLTPELTEAITKLGHSREGSLVAAQGRHPRQLSAGSLAEAGRGLGLSPLAARPFARGRGLAEAVADGSGFKATDYAFAGDSEDPSTWRYLLVTKPGDGAKGAYDKDLVTKAATALSVDAFAVNQPDIPKGDLASVKQTVAGAWTQVGLPLADMPPGLTEAALANTFRKGMNLSAEASLVAARGRSRRS